MRLDQQFRERTLHILRETVLAHACAAGMPEDRATDLALAVHELAANAVRYGGGAGRLQMCDVSGKLTCQVSDPGPGSAGGAPPDGRADPWPYLCGHGLWLARKLADDIAVWTGPGGSRVTMVFALNPDGTA